MIDNAFAIAVEPLLQIATNRIDTTKLENNFEVIYDDEWVGWFLYFLLFLYMYFSK